MCHRIDERGTNKLRDRMRENEARGEMTVFWKTVCPDRRSYFQGSYPLFYKPDAIVDADIGERFAGPSRPGIHVWQNFPDGFVGYDDNHVVIRVEAHSDDLIDAGLWGPAWTTARFRRVRVLE